MKRTFAWLVAAVSVCVAMAMVPMSAGAVALPAPTLLLPGEFAMIDQPQFAWDPIEGASSYEIEVALDNQFVTITDTATVRATLYIPTRTYVAKTLYWRVRAKAADGSSSPWSGDREFTRRWTTAVEPVGANVDGVPASRVENMRSVVGGDTPAINQIAFTWDAVPGAAYYQVQFSDVETFQDKSTEHLRNCYTPHLTLAPYFSTSLHPSSYVRRLPVVPDSAPCGVNMPAIEVWTPGEWSMRGNEILVRGQGPAKGASIVVRYGPSDAGRTVTVRDVGEDALGPYFLIPQTGAPQNQVNGTLEWHTVTLNFTEGVKYYARVRAIDAATSGDYPADPVFGLWSDQKREPSDSARPLEFTPSAAAGGGSINAPLTPTVADSRGTDLPILTGTPVGSADAYRFVIALDRDFTDIVGQYVSRSALLVPEETYDDNGPNKSYYWYALPCEIRSDVVCTVADRDAINSVDYVRRFAKHSAPVNALTASMFSSDREVLLQWSDASSTADASGTGGVRSYEVQMTWGDWSSATSVVTDNLAWSSTASTALYAGTYRWRVRPRDGQDVPLAWTEGPSFTIPVPPVLPTPTPTQDPLSPSPSPPNPEISANYDLRPGAGGGAASDVPSRPGKPRVAALTRTKLMVRWSASQAYSDPVSGYVVLRSRDGQTFKQVGRTSSRWLKVKARPGRQYWFHVVAVSAAGRSPASRTTVFTMPRR